MSSLLAPRRALSLAVLLVAASFAAVSLETAVAQQPSQGEGAGRGLFKPPHRGPAIGGTSLTLRDIWGPAEMPPAPMDFGPGFDYAPGGYTLDGVPNNAPYPN